MTATTRAFLFVLASVFAFGLSACGLKPVYGTYAANNAAPVATSLDNIYIAGIADRSGQKLRNLLIDRIVKSGGNTKAGATYTLDIQALDEDIYGLGIAKDATATRSQLKLSTKLALRTTADAAAKPLLVRNLTAITSFNTLGSQYTTLVTEEDARNQAIEQLAEQAITMLELYFSNPQAFAKPE